MTKKVYIQTHGCQMNEYDSDKMLDLLAAEQNMVPTTLLEDADLLLLNTCSIREKAQEKVFSLLGRWKKIKDKNPNLVIGIAGCVASQEGELIQKRAPYVDLVFGPQTLHRLPEMLRQVENNKKTSKKTPKVVDISFPEIEKFDHLPKPKADGASAYVSIMEGCSKYCTFCVVPYTRGEEVSRPFDDVITEVSELARQGVKEIHLLGQNVNAYRGNTHDADVADLALLIHYVAAIDGVERIRFTTSHPVEFSDNLVKAYENVPELVSFVHLPVQAGSDRILTAMKRGHTAIEYKSIIRKLRKARPSITISSDFIIGFPGETEEDFNKTIKLIKEVGFDHSYSFIYSARPGTPAASMQDDVSLDEKKVRLQQVQELIKSQAKSISESMLNTRQRVLVEAIDSKKEGYLKGKTDNSRGVVFKADAALIGQVVYVDVTNASTYMLQGKLVSNA